MAKCRFAKLLIYLSFVLLVLCFAHPLDAQQNSQPISQNKKSLTDENPRKYLESILESIRQEYKLPALAASILRSNGDITAVATGVRVQGKKAQVKNANKFSIGSITKPMTATVIATLVEEGKLAWTTRVLDVFPEFKDKIHPTLKEITLEQLLAHRAGIAAFEDDKDIESAPTFPGNSTAQRFAFSEWLVAREAVAAPGTKKIYSNAGYAIAAAMAERISGQSFETLMRKRLFVPLGMKSAGIGWAARTAPNQPWGHRASADGFTPHNPNDSYQLGAKWMPAGDVHCNMRDLAKFAAFHLRGLNGQNSILQAETIKKLHTPYGGSKSGYSLGWNINSFGHSHFGGTGTFAAVLVLFPKEQIAISVAMNAGDKKDEEIELKIIDLLFERYVNK